MHFVEPGVKVNGARYRDILLQSNFYQTFDACLATNTSYSNRTVHRYTAHEKQWHFCELRRPTSYLLTCGHLTHTRSKSCWLFDLECVAVKSVSIQDQRHGWIETAPYCGVGEILTFSCVSCNWSMATPLECLRSSTRGTLRTQTLINLDLP